MARWPAGGGDERQRRAPAQPLHRASGVFPAVREFVQLRVFPKHLSETVAVDVPADGSDVNLGPIAVVKLPPQPTDFPSGEVARPGSVSTGIVVFPFSHPPKVFAVIPGSPAALAGVQAGATILEIDGHAMAYGGADGARFLLDTPGASHVSVKLQTPNLTVQTVTLEKVNAKAVGIPVPM